MENTQCPCQSGSSYNACCQPYIEGNTPALTPESLMRSRYTAYTQANIDYITQTMRGKAAQHFDPNVAQEWASSVTWLGLNVLSSSIDKKNANKGFVEFFARYQETNGQQQTIFETSEFSRDNDKWFYVDGKKKQISRNDACPCGSKKKFKRCCCN